MVAFNQFDGSGTGFSFNHFSGYWLMQTLKLALEVYNDYPEAWKKLQWQAMSKDFSWDTACVAYEQLYQQLQ